MFTELLKLDLLEIFGKSWIKFERFVFPVMIIAVAIVISRILSFFLNRYLKRSTQLIKVDVTNYTFLLNGLNLIIYSLAVVFVFYQIPALRTIGKTLFAGAGILAAIIGFASQEAFSNIISGIFLVIFKPFSVGDFVRLLSNNQVGAIEDITLRHTILRTLENRRIVIPNTVISREAIINSSITDERINLHVEFVVDPDTDIDRALAILRSEAEAHPMCIDIRNRAQLMQDQPKVLAKVVEVEELGIRIRAYTWAANPDNAFEMRCDLLKTVLERFHAAGIKVAFAQRLLPQ